MVWGMEYGQFREYYHDERMRKMFQLVEEPKSLEDIDISANSLKILF